MGGKNFAEGNRSLAKIRLLMSQKGGRQVPSIGNTQVLDTQTPNEQGYEYTLKSLFC